MGFSHNNTKISRNFKEDTTFIKEYLNSILIVIGFTIVVLILLKDDRIYSLKGNSNKGKKADGMN